MRPPARHLATLLLGLALAAGGACSGDIMDPDMDPPTGPTLPPFSPAPGNLHRLTVAQYQNTVRDLLGDDITVPTELEADTSLNGFIAIGASRTTISRVAAEQFEVAAYDLAAQALEPARRDR